MKKLLLFVVLVLILSSCRIASFTMVSTRNVETSKEYKEIDRYVKGSGTHIEDAVDKAVKKVDGGEFMKNVVVKSIPFGYSVKGDVWGTK